MHKGDKSLLGFRRIHAIAFMVLLGMLYGHGAVPRVSLLRLLSFMHKEPLTSNNSFVCIVPLS